MTNKPGRNEENLDAFLRKTVLNIATSIKEQMFNVGGSTVNVSLHKMIIMAME